MKFSAAALLIAATGAAAGSNVTYVTDVVESYTTYCPYATQITHGSHTYTVTAATTLTITDCPCTITRPVTSTAVVSCPPTLLPPPTNATWTTAVGHPTGPAGGNGGNGGKGGNGGNGGNGGSGTPPATGGSPPGTTPTNLPSSAGKVAALSGGALAGVIGLAAFIL